VDLLPFIFSKILYLSSFPILSSLSSKVLLLSLKIDEVSGGCGRTPPWNSISGAAAAGQSRRRHRAGNLNLIFFGKNLLFEYPFLYFFEFVFKIQRKWMEGLGSEIKNTTSFSSLRLSVTCEFWFSFVVWVMLADCVLLWTRDWFDWVLRVWGCKILCCLNWVSWKLCSLIYRWIVLC